MSKRILFCTAEGIGNVMQCAPAIRSIKEKLGFEIDLWHAFGSYQIPKIIPHIDRWMSGMDVANINPQEYIGKVSTWWTKDRLKIGPLGQIKLLTPISNIVLNRSEVDVYMDIARNLGVEEEDLLWYSGCSYAQQEEKFDLVIHDGYNRVGAESWKHKSYSHYMQVVELLKDLKICSVGSKKEYIKGTINRTGLNLYNTLGIVKNSKLFLSNDSGLYHCANALGVNNIVIFTYTSQIKNYDKRFHKFSKILCREDLDCLSCQNTSRWKECKTHGCKNIDTKVVADMIVKKLL